MGIKVRAVRLGYYGDVLRHPGDVFEIREEKEFSDSKRKHFPGWMERLSEADLATPAPSFATPPAAPKADEAAPPAQDLAEKKRPGRPKRPAPI